MWKYLLGVLASIAADDTQRDSYRTRAVVAVSVARASLEVQRQEAPSEAAEEEEEETSVSAPKAAKPVVQTQKKATAPVCVDGKCHLRVVR